jgi:hypothetical protein
MNKIEYNDRKKGNREQKQKTKRKITADEVIFIFEKVIDDWKTIKIFNSILQNNPNSNITKQITEKISTGNCKIYENELTKEKYEYYLQLRQKVYDKHII